MLQVANIPDMAGSKQIEPLLCTSSKMSCHNPLTNLHYWELSGPVRTWLQRPTIHF